MAKSTASTVEFALNLPTKSQKALTQLRDGLRVMFWTQFKSQYKELVDEGKQYPTNYELYAVFDEQWKQHSVQSMDLVAIRSFIKSLEYSEVDVNQVRKEYYEARRGITATIKANIKQSAVDEEIPY